MARVTLKQTHRHVGSVSSIVAILVYSSVFSKLLSFSFSGLCVAPVAGVMFAAIAARNQREGWETYSRLCITAAPLFNIPVGLRFGVFLSTALFPFAVCCLGIGRAISISPGQWVACVVWNILLPCFCKSSVVVGSVNLAPQLWVLPLLIIWVWIDKTPREDDGWSKFTMWHKEKVNQNCCQRAGKLDAVYILGRKNCTRNSNSVLNEIFDSLHDLLSEPSQRLQVTFAVQHNIKKSEDCHFEGVIGLFNKQSGKRGSIRFGWHRIHEDGQEGRIHEWHGEVAQGPIHKSSYSAHGCAPNFVAVHIGASDYSVAKYESISKLFPLPHDSDGRVFRNAVQFQEDLTAEVFRQRLPCLLHRMEFHPKIWGKFQTEANKGNCIALICSATLGFFTWTRVLKGGLCAKWNGHQKLVYVLNVMTQLPYPLGRAIQAMLSVTPVKMDELNKLKDVNPWKVYGFHLIFLIALAYLFGGVVFLFCRMGFIILLILAFILQ